MLASPLRNNAVITLFFGKDFMNKPALACASLLALLFVPLSHASAPAIYFGGGYEATHDDKVSANKTSGYALEGGFKINENFSLDVKHSETTFDKSNEELKINYAGLDIGSDLDSENFSLYGKLGYADASFSEGISDSNVALGLGFRIITDQNQEGFYFKIEALRIKILTTYTTSTYAGFGYQF